MKRFRIKPKNKVIELIAGAVSIFVIILAAAALWFELHPPPVVSQSAAPVKDNCAIQGAYAFPCYKQKLTELTQKDDPQAAFSFLKQEYKNVSYVHSQCHQLAHVIGRAALAKYGNLTETFTHGDQFCWAGYYHGAMEEVAKEQGTQKFLASLPTICQPIKTSGAESFNYYNCVHGLGHGVMEALGGNLFTSLQACDSLLDDYDRSSCYGGVFMQNIMIVQSPDDTVDHSSAYLKADQPMYPCTVLADRYEEQCYLMQSSYALQVEAYDFTKVFPLCAQAPAAYRDTCYQSIGRDASGQSVSTVDKTRSTCMLGSDYEAQSNCIIGAAKDFVAYYHSDKPALQLCASLATSQLRSLCVSTVQNFYQTF